MMRIQGSVRSKNGIPASQIVWTMEENTLQRSGLPREFTFVMLIAKPGVESRVQFVLEIEPVLQCWILGQYPGWWVKLWKRYRAARRKRGVDFRVSVGQRFGDELKSRSHTHSGLSRRGFNFAKLVAGLDEYVTLSGGRVMVSPSRLLLARPKEPKLDADIVIGSGWREFHPAKARQPNATAADRRPSAGPKPLPIANAIPRPATSRRSPIPFSNATRTGL